MWVGLSVCEKKCPWKKIKTSNFNLLTMKVLREVVKNLILEYRHYIGPAQADTLPDLLIVCLSYLHISRTTYAQIQIYPNSM